MIQRLRVPLGFVVAAAVMYFANPTFGSILAGLPIAVIGALFRGLSAGVIKKDSVLATAGPYAWTRNPLYFGTFLLVVGFAVMSLNLLSAALLLLPFGMVYPSVIRSEEAHLDELFGADFRRYCREVPRFFPRFGASIPSFSFEQYWKNREYDAAIGLIAAVAVFLLKARLAH